MLVGALTIGADQLTKHWALNALDDGATLDLVWTLRFKLAFNENMAFSFGGGAATFVPLITLAVTAAVLWTTRHGAGRLRRVAAGLLLGGALGNIVDRLVRGEGWMRGAVVDFIDLQWWPIFNLADVAIVVGVVLLGGAMLGAEASR